MKTQESFSNNPDSSNISNNWRRYLFEFLSIFIGVTLAFTLERCNENRRDRVSETKTLMEISNGLHSDLIDLEGNIKGHQAGIVACQYFRKLINNELLNQDSIGRHYILLLRDFISIQNKSGYESLKSKGLELISNDSLRLQIIDLYDFDYEVIEKLEEQYAEKQFHTSYFASINDLLVEYMEFDSIGELTQLNQPIELTPKDQKTILSYLWKMEFNRNYRLKYYGTVKKNIEKLIKDIDQTIES